MGILSFLKKESKSAKKELPPLPDISSLPPLPDMPESPAPQTPAPPSASEESESLWGPEDIESEEPSTFPEMPAEEEALSEEGPMFPDTVEEVPEKIPDLEELPEPPSFRPRHEVKEIKPLGFPPVSKSAAPKIPSPSSLPTRIPQLEGFPTAPFIPPEKPRLVRQRVAQGPLFVRMDEYKEFLDDIERMRNDFKENENIYVRLNDYRTEQDKHFEKFHEALEDVQRKLLYIDKTLFEAQ
ncbi:MAG: hypothetical protein KJ574_01405 [Nanoarchaeota archaeon]|nr:hypothetical protein [Nanoarchaeota archaeon]